ncbi:hypothetical protein O0235_09320 [Tepidiforma flava]|uniref:Uncharacterized protein n=1 Tax=Tepidiforma flava TaxID=3004094 RepID=A0ABY7M4R7_9CHLR|nr:hypothetical protein [Tepidiforma flava]WBL34990.1 hypothetical protein O0235_09320 [Tepidiforma flava]
MVFDLRGHDEGGEEEGHADEDLVGRQLGPMPIAFRTRERTTMMRVKEVTITRMAGARERTVMRTRSWMAAETLRGSWASAAGSCGAAG